jgi:hypothetical protein
MPAPENPAPNKLYYGDNLAVLRDYIPDQSVDLIYLDPLLVIPDHVCSPVSK